MPATTTPATITPVTTTEPTKTEVTSLFDLIVTRKARRFGVGPLASGPWRRCREFAGLHSAHGEHGVTGAMASVDSKHDTNRSFSHG
jgi:hypothetical protein